MQYMYMENRFGLNSTIFSDKCGETQILTDFKQCYGILHRKSQCTFKCELRQSYYHQSLHSKESIYLSVVDCFKGYLMF